MVNVPYKKTQLYDELTERYGIFEHYYDVIMFLAVLCYREGEPKTDDYKGGNEGERGSIGIGRFHGNSHYHAIVASLAYQRRGSPEAMANAEVHADVISQYAAGGLEVYGEKFGDVAGDPTDAIANYINSCTEDGDPQHEDDELQTILRNFEDLGV